MIRPVSMVRASMSVLRMVRLRRLVAVLWGVSPSSGLVPVLLLRCLRWWAIRSRVWVRRCCGCRSVCVGLAVTLVTGGERSVESPVSVVGVSRIAGEVTATDRIDVKAKAMMLVSLVANMNLMLFAFNLIPLLPLDGGHVRCALGGCVRRFFARLTGRKDPGPFDPVKLLPLTYVVAGAFIVMSVILIVADIVKPITLF